MSVVEERKTDFFEDVYFHYKTDELRTNYLLMIKTLKETCKTLPPEVIAVMHKQTESRLAMQLMMSFVLGMDDTNGLTQFAVENARPKDRMVFFKHMLSAILRPFLQPQRAGDARVPDPTHIMPILYSEYMARRDKEGGCQAYYEKLAAEAAQAATASSKQTAVYVPQGDGRGNGT